MQKTSIPPTCYSYIAEKAVTAEKTMKINRCLEPEGYCDRYETCPMHAYYTEVQKTLEDYFGRDTLQDVIDHGKIKRKGVIHDAKERQCDTKCLL